MCEILGAVSILQLLTHHQLAEHSEHVRSRHRQLQGVRGKVHPM